MSKIYNILVLKIIFTLFLKRFETINILPLKMVKIPTKTCLKSYKNIGEKSTKCSTKKPTKSFTKIPQFQLSGLFTKAQNHQRFTTKSPKVHRKTPYQNSPNKTERFFYENEPSGFFVFLQNIN
jgi:hypothetical protein